MAEICVEISAPPVQPSYNEYTDHTLLVGSWNDEGKDWPLALI